MHWAAVVLAAYAAGFVEFWRLCENAPSYEEGGPLQSDASA